MNIPINEIKVKKRIRKNPGNIEGLKISLSKIGLINPIVIDENNNLIAGFRRLKAAKELGWDTISATVLKNIDSSKILDIEAEENFNRLNFTAEDYNEYLIRKKRLTEPNSIFTRIFEFIIEKIKQLLNKLGL